MYKSLKTISLRTAMLVAVIAGAMSFSTADTAEAGYGYGVSYGGYGGYSQSYVQPQVSYRWVVDYKVVEQPYYAYVTRYHSCGTPYTVKVVKYRAVQVPFKRLVTVRH